MSSKRISGPTPHTNKSTLNRRKSKDYSAIETQRKDSRDEVEPPRPPSKVSNRSGDKPDEDERNGKLTSPEEEHNVTQTNEENGENNSRSSTPASSHHDAVSLPCSPRSVTSSAVERVKPEDFDARSFLSCLSDLSERLRSSSMTSFDQSDVDASELDSVVSAVTVSMENFRNYAEHSQRHLEALREQLRHTKEGMHKKIAQHPYDPRTGALSFYITTFSKEDFNVAVDTYS